MRQDSIAMNEYQWHRNSGKHLDQRHASISHGEFSPASEEVLADALSLSPQDLEHLFQGSHKCPFYPRPLVDHALGQVLWYWLRVELPVGPSRDHVHAHGEPLFPGDSVIARVDGVTQGGLGGLDRPPHPPGGGLG